jgi:hypothetical protein
MLSPFSQQRGFPTNAVTIQSPTARRQDRMTRQWLANGSPSGSSAAVVTPPSGQCQLAYNLSIVRFSLKLLISVAAGSERQHIQRKVSPLSIFWLLRTLFKNYSINIISFPLEKPITTLALTFNFYSCRIRATTYTCLYSDFWEHCSSILVYFLSPRETNHNISLTCHDWKQLQRMLSRR